MVFVLNISEGHIRGAMLLPSATNFQEYKSNIENTIGQVSKILVQKWKSPLSEMNFLGSTNWDLLIQNATTPAKIGGHVLCDILSRQKATQPDKVAVESWDGTFTYAELHDLVLRMASVLLDISLAVEERVGICMKKSKLLVVAYYAIVQAGCTGVALDFEAPAKRTQSLLSKVGARLVVADEWTLPTMAELDVEAVRCDSDSLEHPGTSDWTIQWPKVTPWTAAFITFTSGSTGFPKAVVAEHGPLYAALLALANGIHLDGVSKVFQYSSVVSDMSLGEFFATLQRGGCIYLPSEEDRLANLPSVLRASRATHVCLTNTVVSLLRPQDVNELRYLVSFGETLSRANLQRLSPHVHMMTAYGITESIIFDSFATADHLSTDHRNVGTAHGTCLWIIEPNDPEKVKPVGAIGEILTEGPVLAREYMGNPVKSAEKFVPAPSWLQRLRGKGDGRRCYRSGDYGLRNLDGTVIFLDRADFQVKLRGWRVELGEIENCLVRSDPTPSEYAVDTVNLPDHENQQTIVVFVRRPSKDDDGPIILPMDEESRQRFQAAQNELFGSLPRRMVPQLFVPVCKIPRNAVGKRDRKTLRTLIEALPADQLSTYQLQGSLPVRGPETPGQTLLQQLWAEVLRTNPKSLGLDHSFFRAGGDSIAAIELVTKLRDHGKGLSVSQIFQTPELGQLSELLVGLDGETHEKSYQSFGLLPETVTKSDCIQSAAKTCGLTPDQIDDMYPATPMQETLMAISVQRSTGYSHQMVFEMSKSLDVERFKGAWEKLIAEEPIFRTRIATLPNLGAVQVVTRDKPDWHNKMTLGEFIDYDSSTPFTYGSPLTRYALVTDSAHALHFVWSGHHAISDGWSRPAMFEAIKNIYENKSRSEGVVPYSRFVGYINQLETQEMEDF